MGIFLLDMKNQLHPGVKWQWRVTSLLGIVFFLIFFAGGFLIPFSIAIMAAGNLDFGEIILVIFGLLVLGLLLLAAFIEIITRMSYNRWFYEFTSEGLRLERGIIWKRYSYVPYERIQNVDIRRGIFARMFGFSAVVIQTAGYSAQAMAEGHIPAVDANEAESIREFILKRISKKGMKQGL